MSHHISRRLIGLILVTAAAISACIWGPGIHWGLDLFGGGEILYEIPTDDQEAIDHTTEVIERRLWASGLVKEAEIRRKGARQIQIQLPGVDASDLRRIHALLTELGSLEMRLLAGPSTPPPRKRTVPVVLRAQPNLGEQVTIELDDDHWTGDKLERVWVEMEDLQRVVMFRIAGADNRRRFLAFTEKAVGRRMAIIFNGQVIAAPVISTPLPGGGQITGLAPEELTQLQRVMKTGALKVKPITVHTRFVGPLLGQAAVARGKQAVGLGLLLVILTMLLIYRRAGLIASVALLLTLLYMAAGLSLTRATLSLPGIAGILLTVGISVDASILIFERMREEQQLERAYQRAAVTILDANLTTLIPAGLLLWIGLGAVKSFALTLLLGILLSLFTSLLVTRLLLELWPAAQAMRPRRTTPNFGFLAWRRVALSLSLLAICGGLVCFQRRGADNFAIDLRGGQLVEMQLTRPLTADQVRQRIPQRYRAEVQTVGAQHYAIRAQAADLPELMSTLRASFSAELDPAEPFPTYESVGRLLARAQAQQALIALGLSLLAILLYIWIRFELLHGVAAIVCLVHDVAITLGALALFGVQLSIPILAAFMTIVGYSLNDTIVIFDRIRENDGQLDKSINQTLGRTMLTTLTTLLAVLSLYLLNVGQSSVLSGFALALIVGVTAGTYSSIFVAAPILHWRRLSVNSSSSSEGCR